MIITILLSVFLIIAAYCAYFFFLSYNEEKEYAEKLHEKLEELPALKKKLEESKKRETFLQRDLELEKQLRFIMQKRYVKLVKEKVGNKYEK